jgi:hypothetical protein
LKHTADFNNKQLDRKRGRPTKETLLGGNGPGGRLDPTSDFFLKNEARTGGPTDPMHQFRENLMIVFPDKAPEQNGLYETMLKLNSPTPESESFAEMSEPRKNMLTADDLICFYLKECATQVNQKFYSTITQFILMYRDCLNVYGWQKRADNECKVDYGTLDYEKHIRGRLEKYQQEA